jgi:hypothetical protein
VHTHPSATHSRSGADPLAPGQLPRKGGECYECLSPIYRRSRTDFGTATPGIATGNRKLFAPISGDGLGPDRPKVIRNQQCHFLPAPLRGRFFCAGLSWWLYIIGMGPRVMPLIFESSYQKLAIYTIGDRTERGSPARTDAGPVNWAAHSTFHTRCLDRKERSMEMWFLRRRARISLGASAI